MGCCSGRVGRGEGDAGSRVHVGRWGKVAVLAFASWFSACLPPVARPRPVALGQASSAVQHASGSASAAVVSAVVAPGESPPPICPPMALPVAAGPASLSLLAEPERLWIHDSWGGLGPSYDLEAHLTRVGKSYEAECTIHVFPMAPDGMPIPDRFEAKVVTVPGERVRALVHALHSVSLEPHDASLIEISPLDDNGESDALLFQKGGGAPLHLHQGPNHGLSVDLETHYQIRDPKEALVAYRSVLDAIGLDRWVETMNQTAIREVKMGGARKP